MRFLVSIFKFFPYDDLRKDALRFASEAAKRGHKDYTSEYPFVHDRLIMLPPRNDVADLLPAANLMIHPAREEGTGTVLVEALANFLPVVCTEACGFSPYVAEAGCTVIPEPFDQSVLNREVMKMLPELSAMRKNIQQYAASRDFCGRSAVAINAMEEFVRGKGSI